MEVDQQIQNFRDFIEQHYHAPLLESVRKGQESLVLDFSSLLGFNTELTEEIIEKPEELLKAAEIAVKEFDLPKKVDKFEIRLKNLPESLKVNISEIRSKHLGKFIWCDGIVRQKSDVRPHVSRATFECPSCGNILKVLQLDQKFKEPSRCSCGRKGKFKEIDKELVDGQGLVLEESPDNLDGAQPKRINVFLKGDLVSPIPERRSSPGSRVKLYGWVSEVPITMRSGGKSTKYDLILEANYVEPMEDDPNDIKMDPEDVEQIKEIAKNPEVLDYLSKSIAPSIYGHDRIKEALILQLAGGCKKERPDGVVTRGDMHMLLIGDPGAGKCVSGDTKIILEDGEIISIKEFQENESKNITHSKVSSINKQGINFSGQTTRLWKRKSPEKLLKIITSTGNKLILTKEHPLFTSENALLFAKRADEFEKGDYLALPSKINVNTEIQRINYKVIPSKANNKVKYKKQALFNEEFSRFLAYLVGDGYVRMRETTGLVSFTNTDLSLLADFEYLVNSLFGLSVSKRKKNSPKEHKECFEYYFSSIEIVRVLEKMSKKISSKSGDMHVPKIVCKSPNHILKEFLSALFDCEAHINKSKREIELSSKSKDLIEQLRLLLLRFGIISQLSSSMKYATNTKEKKRRKYYRLRISGKDVLTFIKEIDFNSKEKKKKCKIIFQSNKKINTNINVVPNLATVLKVLRQKHGLRQSDFMIPRSSYQHYERGDRNPSFNKLKWIVKKYKSLGIKDVLITLLEEQANSDIFYDTIASVEEVESKENYVYDLEIDSVHNFVANGVMVHNSQLLKRMTKVAPKARFTSGKGASAAGLTASVVKDEFLGGWSLEAGTLVLANRGFAVIDEMDKMSKEDRSALHEAMEQQTVSISKANIQATLRCETTLLAAANPKFGRFDPYDLIANQINLPPALINRFDLIFPVKDLPNKEKDKILAGFILKLHQNPGKKNAEVDSDILKKYFIYIRARANPKLSDAAIAEIQDYYVNMRNMGNEDEGGIRSIPISPRQLEALVRLSEASAKLRLAKTVSKRDAQRAISLIDYSLNQIAKDSETGKIDIDRISSKITASQRSKISIIKEIIHSLESQAEGKIVPIENIVAKAQEMNVKEDDVDEVLTKLRRSGDIYEPKKGFIQRL